MKIRLGGGADVTKKKLQNALSYSASYSSSVWKLRLLEQWMKNLVNMKNFSYQFLAKMNFLKINYVSYYIWETQERSPLK